MFGFEKKTPAPVRASRQVVDEDSFRVDRAHARRAYIRIVQQTKGLAKWSAEDDAALDILDTMVLRLHRQSGKPVPMEVLDKPEEIAAQADEHLRRLEADTARDPLPEAMLHDRPVVVMAPGGMAG